MWAVFARRPDGLSLLKRKGAEQSEDELEGEEWEESSDPRLVSRILNKLSKEIAEEQKLLKNRVKLLTHSSNLLIFYTW